jgi:hypothetical protein
MGVQTHSTGSLFHAFKYGIGYPSVLYSFTDDSYGILTGIPYTPIICLPFRAESADNSYTSSHKWSGFKATTRLACEPLRLTKHTRARGNAGRRRAHAGARG